MITSMTLTGDRIGRLDVAIALFVSAAAVLMMVGQAGNETRDVSVVAAPFALALTIPLLWRRAAPVPAIAVSLAALLVYAAVFGGGGMITCFFTVPMLLLFAYAAGAQLPDDVTRRGLGLSLAFALAICLTDGPDGATPESIVFVGPIAAALWGLGRLVRSRTAMAAEL
ncbi:MAG TPA: hypothetical protein VLA98_15975, partial [Solirubrobacteraceae bacterium]|nr:hypothetical protein [Solirubrobacteraceae bacterium]